MKKLLPRLKEKIVSVWVRFKALPRKKKIAVLVAVVIAFLLISRTVSNATKEPPYKLAKAEVGEIEEIVSETGNIINKNRVDIYSPSTGVVTRVHVENGQSVQKNQILFEVESSATEQEKRAAEANYLTAVSALNSARSTRDLLQAEMFSSWQTFQDTATSDQYEHSDGTPKNEERANSEFHIAEKTWIASEKKYKDQVTAISQAQANVSSTKLLLDATKDARVLATADGIVENLSVTQGSGVTINQVLAPVRPVITIVGNAPSELSLKLGESDIAKVAPGQEVDLDVSAVDEKKYKGRVVRVDSVGTDEGGVIRYTVYVEVLDPDSNIKPGMSVDAKIKTQKLENVLIVPNSSVKPYQGGRAVRVVGKNQEIEYIPVETGIRGTTHTQIISGIEEGEEVVTALSNESIKRPSLF